MLKRDGKVYTQIVKNYSASELIPILSELLKESASTRAIWTRALFILITGKLMTD